MLSHHQAITPEMHETILLLILHMLLLLQLLMSLITGHLSPIMERLLIYLLQVRKSKVLGLEKKLCVASFESSYHLHLNVFRKVKLDLEHP